MLNHNQETGHVFTTAAITTRALTPLVPVKAGSVQLELYCNPCLRLPGTRKCILSANTWDGCQPLHSTLLAILGLDGTLPLPLPASPGLL